MFGCLVLLLVVVPAHAASQCAPTVEKRTLLRPRASVAQDGVEYLGFSNQPSMDYCHKGKTLIQLNLPSSSLRKNEFV